MTIEAVVDDQRLVARIVNLAARCGCRYTAIEARPNDERTTFLRFDFAGTADALRLLEAQVSRLIATQA